MPLVTNRKLVFFRLLVSFFFSVIAVVCAYYLLNGPKLGVLFDFLISKQKGRLPASEILVIESSGTNTVIDPSTAALAVITMAEFDAETLIIQTPVLGVSYAPEERENEMFNLFNREFNTIGRNIINLFDGIRMGTIEPQDTPRFVEAVIKVAESAKVKLVNETVRTNAASVRELEEAMLVFPNTFIADDNSAGVGEVAALPRIYRGVSAVPLYSRVSSDTDGHYRRVIPVDADAEPDFEHVVYSALKQRFGFAAAAQNPAGNFLIMEKTQAQPLNEDRIFTLDKNSALIICPVKNSFRKISFDEIVECESLERSIYRILSENSDWEKQGFSNAASYPPYLWEREYELRKSLFETPVVENVKENEKMKRFNAWREAKEAALKSLAVFFDENEIKKDANPSMLKLKEYYEDLYILREKLKKEISLSFCIIGQPSAGTRFSAELADAIISGKAVKPAGARYIFFASIIAAFLCAFILRKFPAAITIITGAGFSAVVLAGFCYSFIITSIWLDPVIPFSGTIAGTFASLLLAVIVQTKQKRKLKQAYGPFVSKELLKDILRAGNLEPRSLKKTFSVIAAIKCPQASAAESSKTPVETAKAFVKFRSGIKKLLLEKGAVIAGVDGGIIIAAFGTPLEHIKSGDKTQPESAENPVKIAEQALREIAADAAAARWLFAVDYGECAFVWTPLAGYAAYGIPVHNAKSLLQQCLKYKTRTLFTEACAAELTGDTLHPIEGTAYYKF